MPILGTIDVVLGVVLFYLLLSLICTAATELIATVTRLRGSTLRTALANLFSDGQMVQRLYDFPLIRGLFRGARLPAAIAPATFVTSLLHLLAEPSGPLSAERLREGVARLPEGSPIKSGLLVLIDDAHEDIAKLSAAVEGWFNAVMERVSGWYKRRAQLITFVVALVVVAVVNADTIQLIRATTEDAAVRAALAGRAMALVTQSDLPAAAQGLSALAAGVTDLGRLGIPLGWAAAPSGISAWTLKLLGLLLTAVAITLGAPFWFDMMKRVAGLRTAAAVPTGSGEKS